MRQTTCICVHSVHSYTFKWHKQIEIHIFMYFILFIFSHYGKVFVCINYTVFPYHTRFLYFLCCQPVESSKFWEMWTWSNQSVQTTTCSLIHTGEWWRGFSNAYAIACDYDLWSELNNFCWMNLPVFSNFYRCKWSKNHFTHFYSGWFEHANSHET